MNTVNDANGFPETADIETASDGYARRFSGSIGAWMLSVQELFVLRCLSDHPGASVLDVGGGHAQLTEPLLAQGCRVTVLGSDDVCRERIATLVDAEKCTYVTGNVIALPFDDDSFDFAVSVRLLPHCERWPELLSEMARVSRHGVVVDYPVKSLLNRLAPWLFSLKKRLEGNTRTWISFGHADVEAALATSGLQVTQRHAQFFWPMVLHRKLKCVSVSRFLERIARLLGLTRACGSPIVLKASPTSVDSTTL